ncbi:HAD family hydrolase [Microbaculum marinum]|uniref:phosphoglycolate phosphatase n=1 Tax=Microbaculum marinum TaxID=1764581 RepID=A0AAW9RX04_9HYPH
MAGRRQVRGVLLDKDGTLIDCDATWEPVIRQLVAELRPTGEPAALLEAAGLDRATSRFRAGSVWAAGSTRDLVRLWWPQLEADDADAQCARVDAICAAMGPHTSAPLLDLDELIRELERRDLVVGIATNDSIASLSAFLDRQGLAGRIPHLIGYDSVARAKPHADMVHAFCGATGLDPEEVAVVGDNTHDLEMARAAGAGWAVGVLSGNGSRDDLAPHADVILDGVSDLLAWIDGGAA